MDVVVRDVGNPSTIFGATPVEHPKGTRFNWAKRGPDNGILQRRINPPEADKSTFHFDKLCKLMNVL
jgi:hypothetical protein